MAIKFWQWALLVSVIVGLSVGFAIEKTQVTGTIQILEVDQNGKTIAVLLETEDQSYIVEPGERSKDLLSMVGKKVTLKGKITRVMEDNQASIMVQSYEVHEPHKENPE